MWLGIWRAGRGQRAPSESAGEGVEIGDVSRREAGHGEGRVARVAILALPFALILSGLKVVVDRREQRGPLKALV